jgi:putative inorganic carbon (HCO3(-)) transporter
MRDLLLLLVFSGFALLIWQRAWTGVLVLAVIAYSHPQSYAEGFVRTLPLFQMFFLFTTLRFILDRDWLNKAWLSGQLHGFIDWRVLLIIFFWLQTGLSSLNAELPMLAHSIWLDFSKGLAGLLLTLLLIDTRRKLFWLIATIGLSIGLVALKGGFWSLITGQVGRVYGPPASQFYDNNQFGIAALMSVPLLFLMAKQINDRNRRIALLTIIAFCLLAILTSWSRGALLALVASGIVFLLTSRFKLKLIFPPILLLGVGTFFMPAQWFNRMGSIGDYASDGSAMGRLNKWVEGLGHGLDHPLFGLGFDGWRKFSRLDWHSSYVESFAEHGFIGFILWTGLLFGSMIKLYSMAKNSNLSPWVCQSAQLLLVSLTAFSVGSIFLGLTYWSLFYHIVLLSVILSRLQNEPEDDDANDYLVETIAAPESKRI